MNPWWLQIKSNYLQCVRIRTCLIDYATEGELYFWFNWNHILIWSCLFVSYTTHRVEFSSQYQFWFRLNDKNKKFHINSYSFYLHNSLWTRRKQIHIAQQQSSCHDHQWLVQLQLWVQVISIHKFDHCIF